MRVPPDPPQLRVAGGRLARRSVAAASMLLFALFVACSDILAPLPPATPQALVPGSIDSRIAAGADDAEEYAGGSVTRSSTRLELVDEAKQPGQTVGLRFVDLPLPPGATVTSAYLQFTTAAAATGATALRIAGQAADHAAPFASTSRNLSSRPTTLASVAWTPPGWSAVGAADAGQRTPDLAAVLQEIVDRPGWRSGNALVLLLTGSGTRVAWSVDGNSAGAPLLHVEYLLEDDPLRIDSFGTGPDPVRPGEPVSFGWALGGTQGRSVRCLLDVDSDGASEYAIDDCATASSLEHAFPAAGTFLATLTATDGVASVAASTPVVVGASVTIAAAGDIACDPASWKFNGGVGTPIYCHMQATSDLILAMEPAAVLALGDVQYEQATLEQFQNSYDLSWGRFKAITHPAVGNHEYLTPNAEGYFGYFGAAAGDPARGYYSFDLGNWHIVALNSSCSSAGGCKAGSAQEKWLRADLAAHPRRCTLAFWHIPRYSSGTLGGKIVYTDFWKALHDHGADLVLVSHDHHYERFAPQDAYGNADASGMRQFVVGTGGKNHTSVAAVQPNSEVRHSGTYGVLQLTLHPTGYDWAFVPEPGASFTDAGSAECR